MEEIIIYSLQWMMDLMQSTCANGSLIPKQDNTWLHIGKPLIPINPSMLEKKFMRNDGME